ncbi:MAG: sugar phosphate isomerase/epimerase [Phycisphaeraceae bacterium]|nr:sugar phosphate isomerase/epimerase [Phycisphaeraceae bacterium]
MPELTRRDLFRAAAAVAAGPALLGSVSHAGTSRSGIAPGRHDRRFRMAVKIGMVAGDSLHERFELIRQAGFDGVDMDSPTEASTADVAAAAVRAGIRVHGVVDSVHWNVRLSDPDESTRDRAVAALERAIRDSHAWGGTSVLLVPGAVRGPQESQDQVWERSIAGIRRVLPIAADLGVRVLIENVWNGFCYTHDGPSDQTADQLAEYIDAIASPWVGSYFDLGNHRKYGRVEQWIRTLGPRIVKLDVKDWSFTNGWTKIGEGDVDWPAVRDALGSIGFTGWATAEVGGGGIERLSEIRENMRRVLGE